VAQRLPMKTLWLSRC